MIMRRCCFGAGKVMCQNTKAKFRILIQQIAFASCDRHQSFGGVCVAQQVLQMRRHELATFRAGVLDQQFAACL